MDFYVIAPITMILAMVGLAFAGLRKTSRLRFRWPGGNPAETPTLQAVDRLALSPAHSLHLVRAGDRELLIGTHASGFTLLDAGPRQPRMEPVAAPASDRATTPRDISGALPRWALRGSR